MWRFLDRNLTYVDTTTHEDDRTYADVSFEMLVPGLEFEIFWEEDKCFHRCIVEATLCQSQYASADPSAWRNKLLLYPDVKTSGLEYESLQGPIGVTNVVIGRRRILSPSSTQDPSTGDGQLLIGNKGDDGTPNVESSGDPEYGCVSI